MKATKTTSASIVNSISSRISLEKEIFNQEITQYNLALVKEAIKHFSTCKFVPSKSEPYDERYFFQYSDIKAFFDICTNPFVDYRTIYDDAGDFFCYEVFRRKSDGPVYKKKNKLEKLNDIEDVDFFN